MVGWHHRLHGHESEQTLGGVEDGGAWRAAVHGVARSRTRLSHQTILAAVPLSLPHGNQLTKPWPGLVWLPQ